MKEYLEIKWHGRIGQGVLPNAAVLAEIMAWEGKFIQAFPNFNKEKNCAFVEAYNRLAHSPLKLHSAIEQADIIIVMDPAIIFPIAPELKSYHKKEPCIIVNSPTPPQTIKEKADLGNCRVYSLDAYAIAREEIGKTNPIPNIPLMTALIYCIQWISLETFKQRLQQSLSHRFPAEVISAYLRCVDRCVEEIQDADGENE